MKVKKNVLIKVYDRDISADGKFIVPGDVTRIGASSFEGCKSLEEVVIPNSVTEIGTSAFWRCTSLKEVIIPNGVTEIGASAFEGCTSLKEVVIPEGVTEIGASAFGKCTSLKEVAISENVTEIGNYAFWGCESMKEVIIPNGVTKIGNYAFDCCQSLTTINWNDKTYPVRCIDGYCMRILTSKNWKGYTVFKCTYFPDDSNEIVYIAEKDGVSTHGSTVREAVSDLEFKRMKNVDMSEHIARIAQQGYMNATDYRLLTGACRQGTDHFLQEHNLTWEDTMPVQDVLKLTEGFYGFERFQETAKEILSYKK